MIWNRYDINSKIQNEFELKRLIQGVKICFQFLYISKVYSLKIYYANMT